MTISRGPILESSSAPFRASVFLVGRPLPGAELSSVALDAVQAVVDALGDREELRVAFDDQPTAFDPGATRVCDQRQQHLGHAATAGGRVHVDHGPPSELRTGALGRCPYTVGVALAQQRGQALDVEQPGVDLG
jgi:hypothetical protein